MLHIKIQRGEVIVYELEKFRKKRNCSINGGRDSPTLWCLCALFSILLKFYVSFYVKKKKMDNFMCLLEFKCAKRLKAHSRAIPVVAIPGGKQWGYVIQGWVYCSAVSLQWPLGLFTGTQYTVKPVPHSPIFSSISQLPPYRYIPDSALDTNI